MSDLPSFDLDAAGLRADGRDVTAGVDVLAVKLEAALPLQCRVERRSAACRTEKVVEAIEVRAGGGRATRCASTAAGLETSRERRCAAWRSSARRSARRVGGALDGDLREQAESSAGRAPRSRGCWS